MVVVEYVSVNGQLLGEEDFQDKVPVYPQVGHGVCFQDHQWVVDNITWHMDKCAVTTRKTSRIIRIRLKLIK